MVRNSRSNKNGYFKATDSKPRTVEQPIQIESRGWGFDSGTHHHRTKPTHHIKTHNISNASHIGICSRICIYPFLYFPLSFFSHFNISLHLPSLSLLIEKWRAQLKLLFSDTTATTVSFLSTLPLLFLSLSVGLSSHSHSHSRRFRLRRRLCVVGRHVCRRHRWSMSRRRESLISRGRLRGFGVCDRRLGMRRAWRRSLRWWTGIRGWSGSSVRGRAGFLGFWGVWVVIRMSCFWSSVWLQRGKSMCWVRVWGCWRGSLSRRGARWGVCFMAWWRWLRNGKWVVLRAWGRRMVWLMKRLGHWKSCWRL